MSNLQAVATGFCAATGSLCFYLNIRLHRAVKMNEYVGKTLRLTMISLGKKPVRNLPLYETTATDVPAPQPEEAVVNE